MANDKPTKKEFKDEDKKAGDDQSENPRRKRFLESYGDTKSTTSSGSTTSTTSSAKN